MTKYLDLDGLTTYDEKIKNYVSTGLSGKQNTLTAGANITISDDTISATDTTYTAGTNITISSGVISADFTSITTAEINALFN